MEGEEVKEYKRSLETEMLYKEWRMINSLASLLRHTGGRVEPLDSRPFVEKVGFAKRELGPFVLATNAGYGSKRPTKCLQYAYETRIITAPFD